MAASPLCISFDFQFVSVHGNECCCPAFLGRGGGHADEGLADEVLVEGEVTELFEWQDGLDEVVCAFGVCAVEEGDEYREHLVGRHLGLGTG